MNCNSCSDESPLTLLEGWTERIRYHLTRNSPAVDMPTTGFTIALVGRDRANNALSFSGTVGTDADSYVYLDPAAGDIVAATAPWRLHWKVTDSFGKVAFFPKDNPLQWNIDPP